MLDLSPKHCKDIVLRVLDSMQLVDHDSPSKSLQPMIGQLWLSALAPKHKHNRAEGEDGPPQALPEGKWIAE